uniref:Uncharacterized protein n=1 Tax=Romanomermis culicivorax TaxID=13658 RepID=A0A915L0P5_ROMCU
MVLITNKIFTEVLLVQTEIWKSSTEKGNRKHCIANIRDEVDGFLTLRNVSNFLLQRQEHNFFVEMLPYLGFLSPTIGDNRL